MLEDYNEADLEEVSRKHLTTEGEEFLNSTIARKMMESPDLVSHKTLIKEVEYRDIVVKRRGLHTAMETEAPGISMPSEPLIQQRDMKSEAKGQRGSSKRQRAETEAQLIDKLKSSSSSSDVSSIE